ncbi:organic solute transporter subunit alpha/Transmembrane protein [Gorgonomyces haynaldii]|nr:organic solute transporter subunit alpha/Transmembrane protein [Gorgonomyces haynaldii]
MDCTQLPSTDSNFVYVQQYFFYITCGFGAISLCMTIFLVSQHLRHFTNPFEQRYIVRIALMVPIYALAATLGTKFYWISEAFDAVRDLYEAVAIYSFGALVLHYLGRDPEMRKQQLQNAKRVRCCPNLGGRTFLGNVQLMYTQYLIIRFVTSLSTILLLATNRLCPEHVDPKHPMFYIRLLNILSTLAALIPLLFLYWTVRTIPEIHNKQITAKFVIIKLTVLMAVLGPTVCELLVSKANIPFFKTLSSLDNSLIVVVLSHTMQSFWMVIASIAHVLCYGWSEYETADPNLVHPNAIYHAYGFQDVYQDFVQLPDLIRQSKQ